MVNATPNKVIRGRNHDRAIFVTALIASTLVESEPLIALSFIIVSGLLIAGLRGYANHLRKTQ